MIEMRVSDLGFATLKKGWNGVITMRFKTAGNRFSLIELLRMTQCRLAEAQPLGIIKTLIKHGTTQTLPPDPLIGPTMSSV